MTTRLEESGLAERCHPMGLNSQEAARRLEAEGYNELPDSGSHHLLEIVRDVLKEPMFLMLLACGGIYLLMGREHWGDAMILLGFVFLVIDITVVQEWRTEKALAALKNLSSPRALVIRDGRQTRIPGREVARGDWMRVAEGDRIAADGVVREGRHLMVDESLLTGESQPVRKRAVNDTVEATRPGGEDLPFVYSGTLVTRGEGLVEVLATGTRSELGRIGRSLTELPHEATPLQKETGRLVATLATVGLTLCALLVVLYALTRGNTLAAWQEGFLAGIATATAMAILPEEFPVILTIFLAFGAWRISRNRVLTRRMPAIETLGAASVLCVDKTGTLTCNRMSLRALWPCREAAPLERVAGKGEWSDRDTSRALLQTATLASRPEPFDPMERAILEAYRSLPGQTGCREGLRMIREYPLTGGFMVTSQAWEREDGTERVVAAKGAPESVALLCRMSREERADLERQVERLAARGLRVLGVAQGSWEGELPQTQQELTCRFLGMIALEDPVRPAVPEAIVECHRAGIRVMMITGDNPVTARAIARQIGLTHPEEVITGPELAAMSQETLAERIATVDIFARMVPEQKLRIVQALKSHGRVVAMTGDGVNDAPALKAAHIGIAMGERGTDVAREAADLVLLDDDFTSIVRAVRLGRRIHDNIRKAIAYVLAVHVPIVGLAMTPIFFPALPLLLLPVHIVFLEMIIDPACSIIFEAEPEEPGIMDRSPRPSDERLFGPASIALSLLQGGVVLGVLWTILWLGRAWDHTDDAVRAGVFTAMVVSNLFLILTNRSWQRSLPEIMRVPNPAVRWIGAGVAFFLTLVLSVPLLSRLFHFDPMHAADLIACLAAGVLAILWFELLKVMRGRGGADKWSRGI
ncbi:MAG: cation-translocating P-type ATPase [Magnetococcales bacterium]|nr:cation-translocating P-type ATPase [Magnetococcales bacterium]